MKAYTVGGHGNPCSVHMLPHRLCGLGELNLSEVVRSVSEMVMITIISSLFL